MWLCDCAGTTLPVYSATDLVVLDGSNSQSASAVQSAAVSFGADSDFSISVWIKFGADAVPDNIYGMVLGKPRCSSIPYQGYYLSVNKDLKVKSMVRDTTRTVSEVVSSDALGDSMWHHIAMVADRDGQLQLYIDGTLDDSADMSTIGDCDNNNNFIVGKCADYSGRYYRGSIKDLNVYNRVISTQELPDCATGNRQPDDCSACAAGYHLSDTATDSTATTCVGETPPRFDPSRRI